MRYRQLGTSGLTVSVVGLGCNNFGGRLDLDASRPVVDAALDAGITLLDTSNTYGNRGGSETILGELLEGRRDEVVLATKWGMDMGEGDGVARGSRRYVRMAVEASLRRLRTDRIDLYQLHRPDPLTPVAETLAALDELVKEGKVRYVGSSNFSAWQVADADWTARSAGTERFISAQNHYSLLERAAERELLPACERFGVGVLPFFPLANGLLTGKHRRGELAEGSRMAGRDVPERTWDTVEALTAFAEQRGHSILELAIGGLLASPVVGSVIAGATRPEQVRANVAAGEWELSADDRAALAELLAGRRAGAGRG
ncbi:MAG TPA: aldo/keto reductase [Acidimicrobiales bacterium]|nr:aldo/keto reductase [Acidimicrobiales bacterium]